jgi:alkylated DNA nucleotide flippase Atl1
MAAAWADVRSLYRGETPPAKNLSEPFDWSQLHTILEALPERHWTTYGDLADAIGTAPQPLGNHIRSCVQCVNAHRILTSEGRVADAFRWPDPNDRRSPVELLQEEGVAFTGDRADPANRLNSDELISLTTIA